MCQYASRDMQKKNDSHAPYAFAFFFSEDLTLTRLKTHLPQLKYLIKIILTFHAFFLAFSNFGGYDVVYNVWI